MLQPCEKIDFGSGSFYRIERWSGDDRFVQIINGSRSIDRVPAYGARWHYHSAIEMTSVLRGTSSCFVADRLQQFSKGEIFILGENVPHYWHHPRHSEGISILWQIPQDHAIWDFRDVKILRTLEQISLRGLALNGETGQAICSRIEGLAQMEGLLRLGGLFQLFHRVLHAPPCDTYLMVDQPFDISGIDEHEQAIRRALSYIHAYFRDTIVLSDLLRITGMSRTTFSRKFLKETNTSFSKYIGTMRIKDACQKLVASNRPIGTIAADCGFTQLSFFNRLFRRQMGMSPKQFRYQHGSTSNDTQIAPRD